MGYVSLYVGEIPMKVLEEKLDGIYFSYPGYGWISVASTSVSEVMKRLNIQHTEVSMR